MKKSCHAPGVADCALESSANGKKMNAAMAPMRGKDAAVGTESGNQENKKTNYAQ